MSFSQQVVSAYYLVRFFYVFKMVLKILFVDIESCLKVSDRLIFDEDNHFDNSQALNSPIY